MCAEERDGVQAAPAGPSRTRLLLVLLPAMLLPFAASLFYFVLFCGRPFARVIYAGTKVFTVVWPVVAVVWILRSGWPRPKLRGGKHLRALPLGLLSGGAVVAAMAGLMLSPVGEVVKSSAPSIRAKVVDFGLVKHYWAFALCLAVVHSLVEEYYWRWFVFGRLRLMTGAWPAHLLAAAAFASHHVVMAVQFFPWGWGLFFGAAVGAGGLIWSLMLSRQKSLAGIWLSHMIVDLGILSIGHKLVFETWL